MSEQTTYRLYEAAIQAIDEAAAESTRRARC